MEAGKPIAITINGNEIKTTEGRYVLDIAREHNIHIPTLCYHESLTPTGACRLCVVEARYGNWSRVVTSCLYPVWDGVSILTDSERVIAVRKLVLELLLAGCPNVPVIRKLAREYGIDEPRFKKEDNDCIHCYLCVRTCDEIVGVKAISAINRGATKEVNTPFRTESDACIGCGSCVYVCPTNHIKMEEKDGYRKIWYKKFRLAYCKKCGFTIGPEEQLAYFRKIAKLPDNFYDLCQSCR